MYIVGRMGHEKTSLATALGQAIKARREAASLTQGQFGELVGIDQGNVSRVERGMQGIDSTTLFAIARVLECPLHLLFEEAEKRTGDLLSKEAIRVARKWQNAPPHQRAAYVALLGAGVGNDPNAGEAQAAN